MDKIERDRLKKKLEKREVMLDRWLLFLPFIGFLLLWLWTLVVYDLAFYAQEGYHTYPRDGRDPDRILLYLREQFFLLPLAFSLGLYNSKGRDEYGCRLVAFDEKKTLFIKIPLLLVSLAVAVWIWRSDIAGLEEPAAVAFYKLAYILGEYLIAAAVYLAIYRVFRAKVYEVQRISLKVMKNDSVILYIFFVGVVALWVVLAVLIGDGMLRIRL